LHLAFNGWPLARGGEPEGALHLTDLLERLPALAPQHRYTLLVPSGGPSMSYPGVAVGLVPAGNGEWARLWFEQGRFPRQAASRKADLLYYPYPAAPTASPTPVAAWHGCGEARLLQRRPLGRLRATLGIAGLSGAAAEIFIGLGGSSDGAARRRTVPPMAPRAFDPAEQKEDYERRARYDLPSSYVLADGAGLEEIEVLLAGWTWVDSAMGDSISLVVLSRSWPTTSLVRSRAMALDLDLSVRAVERVKSEDLPAVYRGAEAFLFGGWGHGREAVCRALACGLAIVGIESPEAAILLGPAAYLVPALDARRLGAACLTVLVEPDVRERLRSRAREQGAPLRADGPLRALLGHLESIVERQAKPRL